jgi:hypothetical protein
MATSIREYIFQDIQTTLQGILERDGYENTIDSDNVIIIHGKRDDSAYSEPIIYIYPGPETLNLDKGEKGKEYQELEVQIEAWIRGTRETMNANINAMLADIKKALGVDHTRGGYAIETRIMANEAFINDLTSEKCGLVINLLVGYEHDYGDPYNQ